MDNGRHEMGLSSISIALSGSGGAGVMTAGAMLLEAAAHAGYYGLFSRLSGPQVRGGEAAALLRISTQPVETPADAYDILFAVDWGQFERFAAEIPLGKHSTVLCDPHQGAPPASIASDGAIVREVALAQLAKAIPGGRPNMVALGAISAIVGLPHDSLAAVVKHIIGRKGEPALAASTAAIDAGFSAAGTLGFERALSAPKVSQTRWMITGDEALGMGALEGGIRFLAGYPITPATELIEWLTPELPRLGGRMVQAEDELASINMALGASFGGVPSMTVTSGPGLSLMVESLGLAAAAEIPVLVIDVMRGGPSTGLPTKTEQGDLNLAIYGAHGDAPRLVLAPTSILDGLATARWAAQLAEALQTPAIVLGDQLTGQARIIVDQPVPGNGAGNMLSRLTAGPAEAGAYRRYALTESGVSPMAIPGTRGGQWIAEGLSHGERGTPSSAARDHVAQQDKRLRKLEGFDFGARWADVEGDGDTAVITWGSSTSPARDAIRRLGANRRRIRLIALRLIAPLRPQLLRAALAGVKKSVVIELNHSGQLFRYLRGLTDFDAEIASYARSGPLPLTAQEIENHLMQWSAA
jgi:2-oxoglutarate ferredoxin oxidoreductase subunit alpha